MLDAARRKRQEEDIEQKAKIDELFLRTRAAAATLKERADSELQEQQALRERCMKDTSDALAKGRTDLEAVVRQAEDIVRTAEQQLNVIKAQAQKEISRLPEVKRGMQGVIDEAQAASSAAFCEVADIRRGLRAECRELVGSLLRTVAFAHAALNDMRTEQQDLNRTLSRGLELEARGAMRHAVRIKELRKHLVRWTAGHEMWVPCAVAFADPSAATFLRRRASCLGPRPLQHQSVAHKTPAGVCLAPPVA